MGMLKMFIESNTFIYIKCLVYVLKYSVVFNINNHYITYTYFDTFDIVGLRVVGKDTQYTHRYDNIMITYETKT